MLPQTRNKLRLFSGISLVLGCALVGMLWWGAKPDIVVQGTPIPTFWEVLMAKHEIVDELQWKILDVTVNHSFFSNLLRFILVLTAFASLVTIVVVYSDTRLTSK